MAEISGGKLRFSPARGVEWVEQEPIRPLVEGSRYRVEIQIDSISRGAVGMLVGGGPSAHWTEPGLQGGEVVAGPFQTLRIEGVTTDAVIDRVSAREILVPEVRSRAPNRIPPKVDLELERVVSEDLSYLSELTVKAETPNFDLGNIDIRHTSVVLRRLLCDGDLRRVAAGRQHKLRLGLPDIAEGMRRAESDRRTLLFIGGKVSVRGLSLANLNLSIGGGKQEASAFSAEDKDPIVLGGLRSFLRQHVLLVQSLGMTPGERGSELIAIRAKISRENVIKYVAHKAGGGHYDRRRGTHQEWALEFVERVCCFRQYKDVQRPIEVYFDDEVLHDAAYRLRRPRPEVLEIGEQRFNPVFLQIVSAVHYLLKSTSIQELMSLIEQPRRSPSETTEMNFANSDS